MKATEVTPLKIKTVDDIKVGMRFITPAINIEGAVWPEYDWLIVKSDNLGADANGIPIQNKFRNKFEAKTDSMDGTVLFCFDGFSEANSHGVVFYQP